MALHRELSHGWTLTPVGDAPGPATGIGRVAATVPGCVHTDLLAADLIPDPYLDDNEERLAWIGRTDWRYATTFDWAPTSHERVDLVCAGLDTVADITVNEVPVGQARNQHRSYRFDLRPALTAGANALAVHFTSAYTYAEGVRDALGGLPGAYPQPYQFIRKMACNFGWDWGPTLVTAGIWRPISLHAWSTARLARVRPLTTVDADGAGRISVHVDVERSGVGPAGSLRLAARLGPTVVATTVAADQERATVELVVAEPELWWPRGYGGQPLYDLEVTLSVAGDAAAPAGPGDPASGGEARLDSWRRRVGFRTIELDTAPDEIGEAFTIKINGQSILVKGANWIPDDCFPTRVDRTRYAKRLAQACAGNLNLLRVWGGGIYESEDFYHLCDELGLLVWQDFLFACAAYPEESPIAEEVEAEAREAVARLCPHPSLVLWNGNNENIEGWFSWGWRPAVDDRTWGLGYYLDVLPRVVAEVDPTRPYWPGSPYSGTMDRDPQDDHYGTKHIWDVWNQRDYTGYRDYVPRFVAEFGYQAPPAYATLRRSVADHPLRPDSPGVLRHQKADDGNGKLARGLEYHFPTPATFDDWHYLTQVNQARAIALAVEHFRAHWPTCTGTIVWQLNDCWPVTSWAAIDGDARPKPLWYALRRAYADRLLTVQPDGDRLRAVLANDTRKPWHTEVLMSRQRFDGTVLARAEASVAVGARGVAAVAVPQLLATPADPATELLVVEADGERALWFFAEDKDLAYPEPAYTTSVTAHADTVSVTITAQTLLRDLVLAVDRLDPSAVVDDAVRTLLPGESLTLRVRASGPLDPAALTREPVLTCVNAAVRRAASGQLSPGH